MSIFEPVSMAIFVVNTQKYSLINYSKIAQKVLNICNNDIVVTSCSFESISKEVETVGYTIYCTA